MSLRMVQKKVNQKYWFFFVTFNDAKQSDPSAAGELGWERKIFHTEKIEKRDSLKS